MRTRRQPYEQLKRETQESKVACEDSRESEKQFRICFDLGNLGMAITSPTKGWVRVNERLCEMLGFDQEELLQKTWSDMTYPDDLAPDVKQFNRVLAGEIDKYEMDKRFYRKDGTIIHTHLTVACVRLPDRSVDYFIASLQDITDLKIAEEELK